MERNIMKNIVLADSVDRLINIDFHGKGLYPIYDVIRQKMGLPLTYMAAKGILDCLAGKKNATTIIGTGFLIDPFKKPETDGLVGAALLARALDILFDTTLVIVTEEEAVETLKWTCLAAELLVCDDVITAQENPNTVCIIPFSKDEETARAAADRMLADLKPELMVSIERAGKNSYGTYHAGLGGKINYKVAKIDYLFEEVRKRGGFTIGVGDLGNELGVGNAWQEMQKLIPFGEKCTCGCGGGTVTNTVSCAPLIGASSEIAIYGLLAVLKGMTGNNDVLHSSVLQKQILWECAMHGAVDGQTKRPSATIDSMSSESVERIVELLHDLVYHNEKHYEVRPEFLDFLAAQEQSLFKPCSKKIEKTVP